MSPITGTLNELTEPYVFCWPEYLYQVKLYSIPLSYVHTLKKLFDEKEISLNAFDITKVMGPILIFEFEHSGCKFTMVTADRSLFQERSVIVQEISLDEWCV